MEKRSNNYRLVHGLFLCEIAKRYGFSTRKLSRLLKSFPDLSTELQQSVSKKKIKKYYLKQIRIIVKHLGDCDPPFFPDEEIL
jgi:Domain of unknown function (DUF4248)